ncbi:MAG: isochorismatase family cysteine hydrolase [Candidatus Scalindua sp.]|nr:isochorismatase family cysteine hydrolase [Candidatus Scalindua sp.]MDV5166909.1 isochorismatase family cysteine hydrolase [Candidatus Scalindua sp.]
MKDKTVFIDIDTQFDFMNPQGNLYVPDAEDIVDNIKKLFDYAKEHKIKILSSTDAHTVDDPEFKLFPAHCIKGTTGNQKIEASTCSNNITIENREREITESIMDHEQIIVESQTFDIFESVNTDKIVKKLDVRNFVVFGVATDYCVKAAVLGLLKRDYNVSLVTDATKSITKEGKEKALNEMKNAGAVFTTTEDIIKG